MTQEIHFLPEKKESSYKPQFEVQSGYLCDSLRTRTEEPPTGDAVSLSSAHLLRDISQSGTGQLCRLPFFHQLRLTSSGKMAGWSECLLNCSEN